MIRRKLEEIGSTIYRRLVFPFIRIGIERRTESILKQGSYLNKGSVLSGKNYLGKETVLTGTELGFGSYVSNFGDVSYTRIGKYTSIGPYFRTVLGKHPVSGYAALHPAFYSEAGQMGFIYVRPDEESDVNSGSQNATSKDTEGSRVSDDPGVAGTLSGKDRKGRESAGAAGGFSEEEYLDSARKFRILIGNDVWIGEGVSVLEGVRIGDGAVIGAGAVVTGDVEPYSVCVGVPAKKIRERFDKKTAEELLKLRWWDKDEDWIRAHIGEFRDAKELIRIHTKTDHMINDR